MSRPATAPVADLRRALVSSIVCLVLTASVLALGPASSATSAESSAVPDAGTTADPAEALDTAQEALALDTAAESTSAPETAADVARPDATLALRDLFLARPTLDGADQSLADQLLARPTDGASDPSGQGYTAPSQRRCKGHFCVHWVTRGADKAAGNGWINTNLKVLNQTWAREIGGLGYRRPVRDGRRGGGAKFDVYLKQIGVGVYGYCTPERRKAGRNWEASGYCVLDNDFARSEFGAPPKESLQVTAAHEFFHAIQFGYDFAEDPWLMEATATWMEEQVADGVDDNRQYLPYGQVGRPSLSLDVFGGVAHYGNWAFFQFLSGHYGRAVVRNIWDRAGEYRGAGHTYSTRAVAGELAEHGGFTKVFRAYASANTATSRTYSEGKAWPSAPATKSWTISPSARKKSATLKINHLASRNVLVKPGSVGRGWQLRVSVAGPAAATSPAAIVRVRTARGWSTHPVKLDTSGDGRVQIGFSSAKVRKATVTAVNASTRFTCNRGTTWSCGGKARDNGAKFTVTARLVKGR